MVGIVLVSHSHELAVATRFLVQSMTGSEVHIEVAAGIGEQFKELGTDAVEISNAIAKAAQDEGALVLMDMGSAILSTEMAVDFLEDSVRNKVKLCPFSFVEGAVAAGVAAKIGGSLNTVYNEAKNSLMQKENHLTPENLSLTKPVGISMDQESVVLIVPNLHGLHARPVARFVELASQFPGDVQITNLTTSQGPVSGKSMTSVMSLEVLKGHHIRISAAGGDTRGFLNKMKEEVENGLGDDLTDTETQDTADSGDADQQPIGISRGIVIDRVYQAQVHESDIPQSLAEDATSEMAVFRQAVAEVRGNLKNGKVILTPTNQKIFLAQAALLDDPEILKNVESLITGSKRNAAWAWTEVINQNIKMIENLKDPNLRQRASDLKDIKRLVLDRLGVKAEVLEIPEQGILLVDNMTPGQVTDLNRSKISGVVCLGNGPTSHSSILLRSFGFPAVIQAASVFKDKNVNGAMLIMDGSTGELILEPTREQLFDFRQRQRREEDQIRKELEGSQKAAVTLDGKLIPVMANIGTKQDALMAAENGADGVGLFRTEFMFVNRENGPTEQEQVDIFTDILRPLKDKPVVIRTLDAGGDKNIPYLNLPNEPNPFLGIRAIRLCLQNEALFQSQLRAILRISAVFKVEIMFPLIATLEELRAAKRQLIKAHETLKSENIAHQWPIKTGMMMEVPSAAILAEEFAREVDFFSIGTNDLIQYTLAADRGNTQLQQSIAKGIPSAVVRLIRLITDGAEKAGIPVAVCGETASHPELAKILLDCGVSELSMNPKSIPEVKTWIRSVRLSD